MFLTFCKDTDRRYEPNMDAETTKSSDISRTRRTQVLTDRVVREATSGGRTQLILYDAKVSGFGLRVLGTGKRAFVFNYVASGRERRLTIGSYPAWGVTAAREHAARLRRDVDAGGDPMAERERDRGTKTIADLWKRYSEEVSASKRPATHRNETSIWERLILPVLGTRKLDNVSASDIDQLHRRVSEKTPTQANRMIASIRHAYNLAIRWEIASTNPARSVRLNHEQPRDRFLSPTEVRALMRALERRNGSSSALALRFILLTGCRRGEALKAERSQFDLDMAIWSKPSAHTKQKRPHRVPLSDEALNVIREALDGNPSNYVFAGREGSPLVEVKKIFRAACAEAGIGSIRIHDLRHTYASILASGGVSLPIVGGLLGHTQAATTHRYAHLFDEPLRAATALVGAASKDETK